MTLTDAAATGVALTDVTMTDVTARKSTCRNGYLHGGSVGVGWVWGGVRVRRRGVGLLGVAPTALDPTAGAVLIIASL